MKQYLWLVCVALCACATSQPAPVIDRAPAAKNRPPHRLPKNLWLQKKDWRPDTYTVKKGDTLYGIGMEFGLDYKEIAQWNNLVPPYLIHHGQQLRLAIPKTPTQPVPPTTEAVVTPLRIDAPPAAKTLDEAAPVAATADDAPQFSEPKALKRPYSELALADTADTGAPPKDVKAMAGTGDDALEWSWPVSGKVLAGFSDGSGSKGLDIAGTAGQPIYAASSGKVVYSGSGLRGYGKLVIIKHNKTYLSAYAHNSRILVKEGQEIVRGQKIAEMGDTDTDRVKLHFEIRKLGKPIDPLGYLPANPK